MRDLEKMHKDAGDLERYLRLQTYPLAIRLLRSESEIPQDARRPKRDEGCQYNVCQAFALSRRNGYTMAMLKEDMYCFEPVVGYGMGEPPQEFLDGEQPVSRRCGDPGGGEALRGAVPAARDRAVHRCRCRPRWRRPPSSRTSS